MNDSQTRFEIQAEVNLKMAYHSYDDLLIVCSPGFTWKNIWYCFSNYAIQHGFEVTR